MANKKPAKKVTGDKLFLCQEGRDRFYVQAKDKATAEYNSSIYNAVVLKEVPMSNLTKDPNKIKL